MQLQIFICMVYTILGVKGYKEEIELLLFCKFSHFTVMVREWGKISSLPLVDPLRWEYVKN